MKYVFFVETEDGARVEWRGLTAHTAKAMYNATAKRIPDNIKTFGYEEQA